MLSMYEQWQNNWATNTISKSKAATQSDRIVAGIQARDQKARRKINIELCEQFSNVIDENG